MYYEAKKHSRWLLHVICIILCWCVGVFTAMAQKTTKVPTWHELDSLFDVTTGDTIPVALPRIISIHTNIIDWVTTTPNVTVEIDLSRLQRNRFSFLLTGKYNPQINYNTIQPRWVYNVASVKAEFRKYWRTGNLEQASITNTIELDSTLWKPLAKLSYFRRRYVSGRYVENPRYWRAYYVGLYAAYNKFSICLDGNGKQGTAYSFGVSAGFSVPLYKHQDGSGWDLDLGLSIGAMITSYKNYKYIRESGCYEYTGTKSQHVLPYPMFQDIHISLAYRFRTIEKKVLYGATRFGLQEVRRDSLRNNRGVKINKLIEHKDSVKRYTDISAAIENARKQLASYSDSTSYYYIILNGAIGYTEKNIEDLKTDNQWQFKRDVYRRNLEYYMHIANEMAPEHLRTDREKREKERLKAEKLKIEDEKKKAKEAEKMAKEAEKAAKAAEKAAAKAAKESEKNADKTNVENAEIKPEEQSEVKSENKTEEKTEEKTEKKTEEVKEEEEKKDE